MKKILFIILFILIGILAYLIGFMIGNTIAEAEEPFFSRDIYLREDGKYASVCTYRYPTYTETFNVRLGVCFANKLVMGDSGFRYPDGSARWEYREFVGTSNSSRSIREWFDKEREERQAC
jgi:hypothetical protein